MTRSELVCPSCGTVVERGASECQSCGELFDETRHPVPPRHTYFPVGRAKFVMMSIGTFGLYNMFWFYKNWKRVAEDSFEDISPALRALFCGLFSFSFFERVAEDAKRRHATRAWSSGVSGTAYLVLGFAARLPEPWWLITMFSFLPLLPVLSTTQQLNERDGAFESSNERLTPANIAGLVVGALCWLLVILGLLVGE